MEKLSNTKQRKILSLVRRICEMESTNCRSLNKVDLARKLMKFAEIPADAIIAEIPLDWSNQVVILFYLDGNDSYYGLFAGIGNDGNFYYELSKEGILQDDGYINFFVEAEVLPLDYFSSQKCG